MPSPTRTFRLSDDLDAAATLAARAQDVDVSDLCRDALRIHLAGLASIPLTLPDPGQITHGFDGQLRRAFTPSKTNKKAA